MSVTYYTSLSGMLAASYGLQNSANNMANMQSPGFKRRDLLYSCLGNGYSGSGVTIGGTQVNFSEGHYLPASQTTDLSIMGRGFFLVKMRDGECLYTRNGEFAFNQEGLLMDKHSHGLVQGYDSGGNLMSITQKGPTFCKGKATRTMALSGQLVPIEKSDSEKEEQTGPFKSNYKNIQWEIPNVYDASGIAHTITIELASTAVLVNPDNPNKNFDEGKSWDVVNIRCEDASITFHPQQLIFSSFGNAPNVGHSSISFNLNKTQTISLQFGDYLSGSNESVELKESKTNPNGTSISAYQQDGFNENGQVVYHYDNGQSLNGLHLALADFHDLEQTLKPMQDNLFRATHVKGRTLGRANTKTLGRIQSKQLESANVDSTTEFANVVVLQRMFQSCSQIMNIDKELIEGLYRK
jgi:flagellar hook protein FlgE